MVVLREAKLIPIPKATVANTTLTTPSGFCILSNITSYCVMVYLCVIHGEQMIVTHMWDTRGIIAVIPKGKQKVFIKISTNIA